MVTSYNTRNTSRAVRNLAGRSVLWSRDGIRACTTKVLDNPSSAAVILQSEAGGNRNSDSPTARLKRLSFGHAVLVCALNHLSLADVVRQVGSLTKSGTVEISRAESLTSRQEVDSLAISPTLLAELRSTPTFSDHFGIMTRVLLPVWRSMLSVVASRNNKFHGIWSAYEENRMQYSDVFQRAFLNGEAEGRRHSYFVTADGQIRGKGPFSLPHGDIPPDVGFLRGQCEAIVLTNRVVKSVGESVYPMVRHVTGVVESPEGLILRMQQVALDNQALFCDAVSATRAQLRRIVSGSGTSTITVSPRAGSMALSWAGSAQDVNGMRTAPRRCPGIRPSVRRHDYKLFAKTANAVASMFDPRPNISLHSMAQAMYVASVLSAPSTSWSAICR